MAAKQRSRRREWLELAGDGAVITAAIVAVCATTAFLITGGFSERQASAASEIASAVLLLVGGVAGPAVAWLTHRRRITVPALVGALVGAPMVGAIFFVFVVVAQALDWLLAFVTDVEYAGTLVAAALVALDFVGLLVWLVVDAARDLRDQAGHRPVDLARILSAVVITVYSATVVVLALGEAGAEMLEAIAFMLLAAVGGASVVTFAYLATRLTEREPEEPAEIPA